LRDKNIDAVLSSPFKRAVDTVADFAGKNGFEIELVEDCRAKERDTFETAGGHIEKGESPPEAAKRELFEETGAVRYSLTPALDYSVHLRTGYSYGQVFLAQIEELGEMPEYEMAEVKLFDAIPEKMCFPRILPLLFEKVRGLV
jgi:8-oxo-dGTP diphosphatase